MPDDKASVPDGKVAELEEENESQYKEYQGALGWLAKLIGAGLCLWVLIYMSGLLHEFGFYLHTLQYNGIFLAGMMILSFLLIPLRKGSKKNGKVPWYDILLILATLVVVIYPYVNALDLVNKPPFLATPFQMVLGFIAILLLFESMRRTIGWAPVIITLLFVLNAKYGYLMPGMFEIGKQPWSRVIATFYLSHSGMFGSLTSIGSNVIFVFIAFGVFFLKVGGGDVFLNLALSLTGRLRGGPAKAAIVGSALFGTLSGSTSANVAVTGSISIPLMKRTGYSPVFAGAVESVASTGGQIMPPIMGSIAFIMAALLRVSYATVALAAATPAILYFISLFIQTDLRAAKEGLHGLPRNQLPSLRTTLKGGWEFGIPILLLVILLFIYRYPPPLVGTYSIGALLVVSFFRKKNRLNLMGFIESLNRTSVNMLVIGPLIASAGVMLALLGTTGLGPRFASGLITISGESTLLLFILAALGSFIMGMGGAMLITYILLAVLVAPAIAQVGVPLIVSHFFIFYIGLTMFFTPPICPAAFIAAGIANANPYRTGMQAVRLGIVAFLVPFILVYNPALVLIGEPLEIVLAIVTAVVGVFALSVGVERYLFTKTNWLQTILAAGAGITMMVPGLWSDVIGFVVLALVLLWQWQSRSHRELEPAGIN